MQKSRLHVHDPRNSRSSLSFAVLARVEILSESDSVEFPALLSGNGKLDSLYSSCWAAVIRQILVVYHGEECLFIHLWLRGERGTSLFERDTFLLCGVFLLQVPEGTTDPTQSLLLHGLRTPQCGDCRLPLGQVRIYGDIARFLDLL